MIRIIIVACLVCASLAVPVPINEAKETFINVIGDIGEWHKVNMDELVDVSLLNNIRWDPGNRYLLFTRKNPTISQLLVADDVESITSSNYNPSDPTVVVAHGYLGNANTNLNVVIRNAFLKNGNFNVIVLDWSRIAMGSYLAAIAGIPNVGQTLGRFLAFVSRTTGAPLQAMHLVGFSLGSHVVGNAGRELDGRVGRVTVCASLAVPVPINEAKETFINVIGDIGEWHKVNMDELVDVSLLNNIRWDPGNRYLLFTRKNPTISQLLVADDVESITSSNYNPSDPTVVVAHGYLGNANTNLNVVIRNAFLKNGNFNVIVLDWSRIAMGSYLAAIAGIPNVGQTLGRFLAFVSRTTGAPLQAMHLVGFSLGSHVVGNAGRELDGRVGRVTGLDPFSPIWQFNSNRLSNADGIYVEVIHTNGAGNGVTSPMGDADFYPNGGNSQPGCITSICNHNRSWELFAATVEHNHLVGTECSSSNEVAANNCRGKQFNMGNADLKKSGNGLYRLNTLARYPY